MEAFLNIIGAALEQLMCECERLRDYLQNNVAGSGIDIPDEVWVPFTAALAFAEKTSTSANRQRDEIKPDCGNCLLAGQCTYFGFPSESCGYSARV